MRTCQEMSRRLPGLEETGIPGGRGRPESPRAASRPSPRRASGSLTRRWPWSSRSATTACTSCCGNEVRRRSKGGGRCQSPQGERFSHEALAVVLQVRHNSLHVLLWQRGTPPFQGRWALPGGPLGADERLGTSVGRHLAAKVDLTNIAYL